MAWDTTSRDSSSRAVTRAAVSKTGSMRLSRAAMLKGCRAGEAGACYQFAFCLSGELLGRSTMSPEDKQDYVNAITTSLDVACRGGVSEGCVLRAGMRQETGTPAPQTCDDVVRACQLGDEADGCLACFKDGC